MVLEGCDAILGAQWLQTLGPILWDLKSMTMKFKIDKGVVTLQEIGTLEAQLIKEKAFKKAFLQHGGRGILLQISLVSENTKRTIRDD